MGLTDAEALVTGTLAALLGRYAADPDRAVAIDDVKVEADPAGNFKSTLTLTMRSGAIIRVIVAEV